MLPEDKRRGQSV